ncbi:hypothetical protein B4U80_13841 [Leptotrombidium deliense]|uniref:C2H2-type domain-containing protein n=1 Tax=Leptotrombidium deliense TaxID=299467 RepID=A0A443SBE7_9ACAR|nr:hypothetical protein B4U80_13841 [Leptotrombidium deliense]
MNIILFDISEYLTKLSCDAILHKFSEIAEDEYFSFGERFMATFVVLYLCDDHLVKSGLEKHNEQILLKIENAMNKWNLQHVVDKKISRRVLRVTLRIAHRNIWDVYRIFTLWTMIYFWKSDLPYNKTVNNRLSAMLERYEQIAKWKPVVNKFSTFVKNYNEQHKQDENVEAAGLSSENDITFIEQQFGIFPLPNNHDTNVTDDVVICEQSEAHSNVKNISLVNAGESLDFPIVYKRKRIVNEAKLTETEESSNNSSVNSTVSESESNVTAVTSRIQNSTLPSTRNVAKKSTTMSAPRVIRRPLRNCRRRYKCRVCDMNYANHSSLLKHIQLVHENVRNHICIICSNSFKSQASLRKHLNLSHKQAFVASRQIISSESTMKTNIG